MSIKSAIAGWFGGDRGAVEQPSPRGNKEAGDGAIRSLRSIADLEAVLAESSKRPVVLFKHSTRCGTSHWADGQYRSFVSRRPAGEADSGRGVLFTHLDLLRHRDVSSAIAERLSVAHQSPQAIVVRDGKAVWHASHGGISDKALEEALRAAVDE